MNVTRVAVAGLGNAAVNLHLPALAAIPGVSIVGGCDPSADARVAAAANLGVVPFESIGELLSSAPSDVLVVCAPPGAHRELVLAGLSAGRHVICEKPLATSAAEAGELVAAAEGSGRRLALNHEFREMPAFRALLDDVRRSGPPVFVQAWQNMDLPPWAEPGWRGRLLNGVLYEAGIHLVDFVLAAFGETPSAVTATTSSCGVRTEASDAVALVTLEFSRGRLAQVIQNRLCKGETQYFEVRVDTGNASHRVSYGGRARLSLGLLRSTTPHLRFESGRAGLAWREQGARRTRVAGNPGNAPMLATRLLLDRTLSAFREGREVPAPGAQGRDVLRVLAAAYLSANSRRTYRLETDAAEIERHRFE